MEKLSGGMLIAVHEGNLWDMLNEIERTHRFCRDRPTLREKQIAALEDYNQRHRAAGLAEGLARAAGIARCVLTDYDRLNPSTPGALDYGGAACQVIVDKLEDAILAASPPDLTPVELSDGAEHCETCNQVFATAREYDAHECKEGK